MSKRLRCDLRIIGYHLRMLMTSPAPYLVLAAVILKLWQNVSRLYGVATMTGMAAHGFGLLACEFSTPYDSMFYHWGIIFLLSGAPFLYHNYNQELVRMSRLRWITIRIVYILVVCIMYMTALQFLLLLISGGFNFSSEWDSAIFSAASGLGETIISYLHADQTIVYGFTPWQAWGYEVLLCIGIWFATGCLMLALSIGIGKKCAIIFGGGIVLWDYIIYQLFPGRFAYISPFSWTKLSIVGSRFAFEQPTLSFVVKAVPAISMISLLIALGTGLCKREIAIQKEG